MKVPLLNFVGGPGVTLLHFEGGPGSHFQIKPWVTRGIRHSMKIRDKLNKRFIKSKSHQIREVKQVTFKKYLNKMADLLRISRESHYQKYFSDN